MLGRQAVGGNIPGKVVVSQLAQKLQFVTTRAHPQDRVLTKGSAALSCAFVTQRPYWQELHPPFSCCVDLLPSTAAFCLLPTAQSLHFSHSQVQYPTPRGRYISAKHQINTTGATDPPTKVQNTCCSEQQNWAVQTNCSPLEILCFVHHAHHQVASSHSPWT